MSVVFQAACNRSDWPCGCITWYEWEPAGSGEWTWKRWLCNRHEIAATRETG